MLQSTSENAKTRMPVGWQRTFPIDSTNKTRSLSGQKYLSWN